MSPNAAMGGEFSRAYWMVVPPDGAPVSLAPDMLLVACQTVPVVLIMKCRVPVPTVNGSAQAGNPAARFVALAIAYRRSADRAAGDKFARVTTVCQSA